MASDGGEVDGAAGPSVVVAVNNLSCSTLKPTTTMEMIKLHYRHHRHQLERCPIRIRFAVGGSARAAKMLTSAEEQTGRLKERMTQAFMAEKMEHPLATKLRQSVDEFVSSFNNTDLTGGPLTPQVMIRSALDFTESELQRCGVFNTRGCPPMGEA